MGEKRRTRKEKIRAQMREQTTPSRKRQEAPVPVPRTSVLQRRPEETRKKYIERLSNAASLRIGMFFVPLLLINLVLTWDEPRIRFWGQVVDQHGEPVPYPVVTWDTDSQRILFPPDSSGETTGDAKGWFEIREKHLTAHTVIVGSIRAAGCRDSREAGGRVFRFMGDKEMFPAMFVAKDGEQTFVIEKVE